MGRIFSVRPTATLAFVIALLALIMASLGGVQGITARDGKPTFGCRTESIVVV